MTEARVEPGDAAARTQAIESQQSVLVQAPAGSGKTTLLTQRYLRLLAVSDTPERILALTFTRMAAQEMRERVLAALRAAEADQCPAGVSRQTWQQARRARKHLLSVQVDLQAHPSRLRIETLDAFNAWLAGQLPIAAGAGSALQVLQQPRPSYEEAARRALAHEAADQFGAAVDRVLELDDQRWRKLVKMIADMLASRDRWLPLIAGALHAAGSPEAQILADVRRRFDEDLALLIERTLLHARELLGRERLAALAALLHAAATRRTSGGTRVSAWLDDSSELRCEAGDLARWRDLAAVLLTKEGSLRKRFDADAGFERKSAQQAAMKAVAEDLGLDPRMCQMLKVLRALPDARYDDAQWDRVRSIAQVLVLAAAELEGVFREQGAVDFAAVSLAALRALGSETRPTDLALRLDYRLQHILVDEFQDTSSAQLHLVRLLTAGWQQGDGRTIFCVGDPMQSIYGFRQAEVRAFLELAEAGIGAIRFDVQRLRSNFRSTQPLVEWINDCFSRLMPAMDDRERGAIAFRPSQGTNAAREDGQLPAAVGLHRFQSRSEEALAIGQMIADQLQQAPGSRIAILVRAKSHAREIAAALRQRQLPFQAVEIEPLSARSVVRDIISLTCALLHWADRGAWLAVLRAPWVGLTLADLLLLARASPLLWDALREDPVLGRLSPDGRARCQRLRDIIEAALGVRNDHSLPRWIECTWLALGGASCASGATDLDSASAAFRRLHELEQRGMPDAADLADAFADLFTLPAGSNEVQIMTIHKAKGLEFDMVVLPALERSVPGGNDTLLMSHQFARTRRDGMVMAARPALGTDEDPLFDFLCGQVREASALEAQRLLYVACTRAKHTLRLTAVIASPAPAPTEFKPRAGSLLATLWPAVGSQFVAWGPRGADAQGGTYSAADDTDESAPRGGALRRVPAGWRPPALAAVPGSAPPGANEPRQDTPVFDWAGETARRVGSLVHAQLQHLDLDGVDEAAIRARAGHFERWLELHGVPRERLTEAVTRTVEALLAVHRDPRAHWIMRNDHREDRREYPISGLYGGQVTRAIFDRSFVDAGIRWVIDYKTSQHQGGGAELFLDREVLRYKAQMARYAHLAQSLGPEPVRLALYFPLMQAWREWAPGE